MDGIISDPSIQSLDFESSKQSPTIRWWHCSRWSCNSPDPLLSSPCNNLLFFVVIHEISQWVVHHELADLGWWPYEVGIGLMYLQKRSGDRSPLSHIFQQAWPGAFVCFFSMKLSTRLRDWVIDRLVCLQFHRLFPPVRSANLSKKEAGKPVKVS